MSGRRTISAVVAGAAIIPLGLAACSGAGDGESAEGSADTLTLWHRGQHGLAAAYVTGSVALALLGVVAGLAAGRAAFA